MASQKLKAASQRKFQRPSTPYIRPKSKGFVQTVKDWLTPSKWISQGVEENNVDTSNDHAPSVIHWPGTPHPIRGHHLDQHGRTHAIKEPVPQLQYSLEDKQDREIVITRGESVPFLAGEEEISTDEEDMDVKETATARSPVPVTESNPTYISRNGLIPATESGPLLHSSQKVTLRPAKKPQVSSNSPKLNLSSSPQKLLTSTPQISPLERLHSSSLLSSASPVTNVDKTPVVVPSTRPSFSVAAFKTPTQTLTNLSLSRSPFNSPFYTGRTAFGGASSGQKAASFRKRTRTDTSSSNTVPMRHVIKSHPPDSTHFSKDAASETARRILDTLQSLSTPLQDARKLPLRVASPAKRQRIEGSRRHHSSPLSPPPPVASLTAPIRAPLSHIKQPFVKVPSEIQPPKETRTVSIDLTSPTPMSPPAIKSAKSNSPFSSQSGKIRSAKHTSHYSSKSKKEDTPSNNPLELPSPIPLPLSTSGALPVFSFGNLLSPNSVLKTSGANSSFSMPTVTVSTMPPIVATPLSTSQSEMYSFKSPTIFTTKSYSQTTPTSTTTNQFQFSKPVIVDETTPTTTKQMSAFSKPSSTLTSTLPTSSSTTYSSPPPPLKSLSVLDALKRPEYQIENIRKEAQKQTAMTDVSKMDASATSVAKQLSLTKTVATSTPTCTTLASASPNIITTPVSNWNCDECWVVNVESQTKCVACGTKRPVVSGVSNATKLTNSNTSKVTISVGEEISLKTKSSMLPPPSTTLPFVGFKLPVTGDLNLLKEKPQTTALTKATPSAPPSTSSNSKSIPLSVFAPPTSNWECPSCLVSNQPEQQMCIACGSKACEDTSKTNIEKSESNSKAKPPLAAFAPPTSNWECPTCMISNKTDVKTCGACGTNKPGGNHGDDTKATQIFKLGESGGLKLSSSLFGKPVSEASSSNQPKLSSQHSGGFKINVSLSEVAKSQSEISNSVTTQVISLKSSESTSVPSLIPSLPNLNAFQPNLTKTTSTTLNIPKPNLTSNTFSGLKFEAPPIVSTSSQPSKPTPALPTIPSINVPNTVPPNSQLPVSASLFPSFMSPTITPTSISNQTSESGNVSTLFPNIGGAGLFGNNKTMASSTGGNNQQLLFGQKESAPFPTLSTSTLQSTTAQTSNIFGGGGSLMATSQTGNAGFAVSSFLTATQASSTTMLASSQPSNISLPVPPQTGLLGGSDCSITQTSSLAGGSSGLSIFSGGPKSTQSSLVFPSFGPQTQLIPTQATGGIFNPSAVSSQVGAKSGDKSVSGGIFGGATKPNPITMSGAATSTGFAFTQMTPSINFTSLPNQGLVFGQSSSSVSSTPFQFSANQSGNQSGISNPSFVFGQPSTNNSFQFTGNQAGNQSGQSSTSIPNQGPIFGQPSLSTPANAQFSFTGGQTGMSIPTVEMSSQPNPFALPASTNSFGRGGKPGRTVKKAVRKRFGGK